MSVRVITGVRRSDGMNFVETSGKAVNLDNVAYVDLDTRAADWEHDGMVGEHALVFHFNVAVTNPATERHMQTDTLAIFGDEAERLRKNFKGPDKDDADDEHEHGKHGASMGDMLRVLAMMSALHDND